MSPEAKVAELIDKENRWKTEVIQQNFLKDDAEEILSIPLPRREMEDKVIWHYDKQGRYSVKSGYQVALKLKFSDPPSCSDSRGNNWGVIWKLNIPEKIKIFAWKAAKNILPTAGNLWKRKIIQEAQCKRCGEGMENTWHALISCKAAKKVWQSSALANAFQDMRSSDLLGELMRFQKILSRADIELLVTTLWVIWYARNKFVFESLKLDPNLLLAKAEAVNEAFSRTKAPNLLHGENLQKNKPNGWIPPPQGWMKINVDAATDKESKCSGLGVVIRDNQGKCMAAAIKKSKFTGDVSYVKAEAAEWGLCIAKEAGLKAVILETDSLEVADLINKRKASSAEIVWRVQEIQALKQDFSLFKVKHVSRSCNFCAHSLAKMALGRTHSDVWWGNFPPEILHVL